MKKQIPEAAMLVSVAQRRTRGDVTQVARELGYSQGHVSLVLAGQRYNPNIVYRAYVLSANRPTYQERLKALTGQD